MANIYQLENPTIDIIIRHCLLMKANERIEVCDFGKNGDLSLFIYKDEDYNEETGEFNLVRIHTFKWEWSEYCKFACTNQGKAVDDTDDIYVSEKELGAELERIYEYRDFATK